MENNILLSIIIPCYNSDRFIAKTLDMLINQGLQSCEVIVINDGSTDRTAEIVSGYTRNYSNIHLISKCNEGVSVARNTGINVANGEYIHFLDSDDTLSPGTLTFFKEMIGSNPDTEMFAFGYKSYRDGKILKKYIYKKYDKKNFSAEEIQKAFLTKQICILICSSIYKKSFLIKNRLCFTPGIRIGEDIEFILKALAVTSTVHYEVRCCFIYQIRNDSTMEGYRTYRRERFEYFLLRNRLIENLFYKRLPAESSFFILNVYLAHLVDFLKSDCNDEWVSKRFIEYSYLLDADRVFTFRVYILKFLVKIIGIKKVLQIFHKTKGM